MSNFAFGSVKVSIDGFGGNRERQSDRSFTIVTGMNGQQRIFSGGGVRPFEDNYCGGRDDHP